MTDPLALSARTGLPQEMRALLARRPRETWANPDVPEMARFWLQMHDGFRGQARGMVDGIARVRSGHISPRDAHRPLIQTLGAFLQHLDGHHRIESGHYFPQFRRAVPAIADGIDLLDRDHDAIHAHLEALQQTGVAFHRAVLDNAPDLMTPLTRLGDALDTAAPQLTLHLDDEEEIVIPLICAHGA